MSRILPTMKHSSWRCTKCWKDYLRTRRRTDKIWTVECFCGAKMVFKRIRKGVYRRVAPGIRASV